jgi:catalase
MHPIRNLFSDRGTPDGYRFLHGFSTHTFSLINAQGERVWVKWHFKSKQGIRNLLPQDAKALAAVADCCSHRDEDDHHTRPRSLFHLMNAEQQQQLDDIIAGSMRGITRLELVPKQLAHFKRVDEKFAAGIAAMLG